MVPQHPSEWAGLEMEKTTETTKEVPPVLPKTNQIPSRICSGTSFQTCDQTGEVHQISGAPVLRTEERFLQEESDSGLVDPQQVHPLRQVQDAHYCADTDPSTSRGLRHLHRSYRRLLACPSSASVLPLPWICTGAAGLRIQDYALRAKYCSPDIHKTSESSNSGAEEQGNSSSGVPGRLASVGTVSRGVSEGRINSDYVPPITGLPHQLQEVQIDSSTNFYLAGPTVGPTSPPPLPSYEQTSRDSTCSTSPEKVQNNFQAPSGESVRVSTIRIRDGPDSEGQTERHGQSLEKEGEHVPPRQERTYSEVAVQTVTTMVDLQEPVQIDTSEASTSIDHHPYRCLPERLGWPLSDEVSTRSVDDPIPVVSYQHPRSDGSVPNAEETQPKEGLSCSFNVRQQYGSSLHKQMRFQIPADQPGHSGNPTPESAKEMAPQCSTYTRSAECDCGCTIKRRSSRPGLRSRNTNRPTPTPHFFSDSDS